MLRACELDESIRQQDVLLLQARADGVDERFCWSIVACRNDLTRDWAHAVGTQPVYGLRVIR